MLLEATTSGAPMLHLHAHKALSMLDHFWVESTRPLLNSKILLRSYKESAAARV